MLIMRPLDFVLMVLINLVWGLNFAAAKYAVDELPPIFATGLRFFMILVLLFPILRPVPGNMKDLILVSITTGAIHFAVLYYGISLAGNMSSVALVSLTNIPFAMLLAVFFLKEKVVVSSMLGLCLSFAGVLVLSFEPLGFSHVTSLFLVVLAAFVYAVGTILMKNLKDIGILNLQAWIGLSGSVAILGLSFILEKGQWHSLQGASWYAKGGIIFSAAVSSIFGHGGIYYLLKRYPVTVITPLTLLSQIFAVLVSVFLLGDNLSERILLGGLLIFMGTAVILYQKKMPLENS